MNKVILILFVLASVMVGCKKKRFCVDAREDAAKQHRIVEERAQMVVDNPSQENIQGYNKAVFYDSIAVDKMNRLCSECKTCDN